MKRVESLYLFDHDVNAGKMIFLSGPRQVGKTTFVLQRLESLGQEHLYYNWDDPLGLSEAMGGLQRILNDDGLISGHREDELLSSLHDVPLREAKEVFEQMMVFGGFPEPFLKSNKRFSTKWRRDYKSLLLYEDLRDLSRIQDVKGVEQLLLMLPERVASPLSINSLREDLQVNHRTVSNWIEALKKIYLIFSIMPWAGNIARAVKKETKVYFYDWTMVPDGRARFENMFAVALLGLVCRWNELGLGDFDLRYIRNHQGREVDFLLIKNNRPFALFEAKENELKPAVSGSFFKERLQIPYYQVVKHFDNVEAWPDQKYVIAASRLLSLLG